MTEYSYIALSDLVFCILQRIVVDLIGFLKYHGCFKWRAALTTHLKAGEKKMTAAAEEKRARRKERQPSTSIDNATYRCDTCGKICGSRIGLFSHAKRCSRSQQDGNTQRAR